MKGHRFMSRWDRAKDSENIVEKKVCENEKGRRQEKKFFFFFGVKWMIGIWYGGGGQAAVKVASPVECPVGRHQLGKLGR